MSISDGPQEFRVFKTRGRRDEFWGRLSAFLDEFPELIDMPAEAFVDDDLELEVDFDPKEPKMIDGVVLIFSVRNLSGHEVDVIMDPPNQSVYMTKGLITSAAET